MLEVASLLTIGNSSSTETVEVYRGHSKVQPPPARTPPWLLFAKLLKDVEQSYDKGKILLEGANFRNIDTKKSFDVSRNFSPLLKPQ